MSASAEKIQQLRADFQELHAALKVDQLEAERRQTEDKMSQPGFWDDAEKAQETVARLSSLKRETETFQGLNQSLDDLEVLDELAADDPSVQGELDKELARVEKALGDLQLRLFFTGPHDALSAFVTIQAGAGGIDACDWSDMVLRMLTRYSEGRGYKVEVLDLDREPSAGIRSATIRVAGRGAFGWLKSERGTHRLVRISPFDAQARRQTAFAAVDVTPEFDDTIKVEIKEADLRVDTFSAGGPGGQHVNKTQSAIRITHLPSGIVVQCQNERHQHANRKTAMNMLKNRLYQLELEKREAEAKAGYATKSNMGFGASDRIRTYTLQPFTLVKDTRTGHEETNVEAVLDGELDGFVESYLRWAAAGSQPVKGKGAAG